MAFGARNVLQGNLVLSELYYHQITGKFSLKFPLCITDTDQFVAFLVRFRVPSAFVQQADSTLAHLP